MRWRHFVAANYRPSLVGILFSVGLCCHRNILVFRNTCLEPMMIYKIVEDNVFRIRLIIESKKNCKLMVWWLNHHAINIIVRGRGWDGGKKKKRNIKVDVRGRKVRLHGGKVRRGVKKIAKNDCYDFFSWKSFFIFFLKLPRHKSLFTYTFLFSFFLSLTFTRHFFCPFVTCWLIKSFLFLFCYMLTKKIWYILHEKEVDCMHTAYKSFDINLMRIIRFSLPLMHA